MKLRRIPFIQSILFGGLLLGELMIIAALILPDSGAALPEYSAQTGEPCATCHISPSGSGPRTMRGQAWVGSDKPGIVPLEMDALEILGIDFNYDPQDYELVPERLPVAIPLEISPVDAAEYHHWLNNFDGN